MDRRSWISLGLLALVDAVAFATGKERVSWQGWVILGLLVMLQVASYTWGYWAGRSRELRKWDAQLKEMAARLEVLRAENQCLQEDLGAARRWRR